MRGFLFPRFQFDREWRGFNRHLSRRNEMKAEERQERKVFKPFIRCSALNVECSMFAPHFSL
jgi:hypothetical protein